MALRPGLSMRILFFPGRMNDAWQPVIDAFGSARDFVIVTMHTALGVEAITSSAIGRTSSGPFGQDLVLPIRSQRLLQREQPGIVAQEEDPVGRLVALNHWPTGAAN